MEFDKEYQIRVPGKCLLSGGYLILEKGEKGLSVSVSAVTCARVVKRRSTNKVCTIHIQSPDLNEEWKYCIADEKLWVDETNQSANAFLYYSILNCLPFIQSSDIENQSIEIMLVNENGFYSNSRNEMCKTGFGTSSTTVLSVVTSLLLCWNRICFAPSTDKHAIISKSCFSSLSATDKDIIFQISSKSHYQAQNNSGSGYDILTGVYGSCIFEKNDSTFHHQSFSLPPEVEILFSCGGKGSKTPALVKCVRQWRQNQKSSTLWNEYKLNNEALIQCFQYGKIHELPLLFQRKIEIMNEIGNAANAEIVPSSIFQLLQESMKLEGVIGCAVAGAGGYDSFYCIVEKEKINRNQLESIWKKQDYFISPVKVTNYGMTVTYFILCLTNNSSLMT